MKTKNVFIIAGPNGSGKTTFAKEFLPVYAHCQNFVNADYIAHGFSPFSPERAALKAGKQLIREIYRLANQGQDFAFETTLSGKSYASFLSKLKQANYKIHIFFLWIPSAEVALLRIKQRVAAGGHNIPESDVRRRFGRASRNLFKIYRSLADNLHFFDNSTPKPVLVAEEANGSIKIFNPQVFSQITKGAH